MRWPSYPPLAYLMYRVIRNEKVERSSLAKAAGNAGDVIRLNTEEFSAFAKHYIVMRSHSSGKYFLLTIC